MTAQVKVSPFLGFDRDKWSTSAHDGRTLPPQPDPANLTDSSQRSLDRVDRHPVVKFVSEDMQDGEIAALYEDGKHAIVMLNKRVTDPVARCEAVTKLMSECSRTVLLLPAALLFPLGFLLHLSEQGASAASQYVQALGI